MRKKFVVGSIIAVCLLGWYSLGNSATVTHSGTLPDSANKADFYALVDNATVTSIVNADISASAAIVDTKLATISTASKVSGAALTSASSIPSGAGLIPTANLGNSTANSTTFLRGDGNWSTSVTTSKIGSFIRDISTASGTQNVTGLGFQPTLVSFFTSTATASAIASWGFDNNITYGSMFNNHASVVDTFAYTGSYSIFCQLGGSGSYGGVITTLGADGFTITWTKSGSPTGNITVLYSAIK